MLRGLFMSLVFIVGAQAEVKNIDNESEFREALGQHELVIARFYSKGPNQEKDKAWKNANKRQNRAFKDVSKQIHEALFVDLNVASPQLQSLSNEMGTVPATSTFVIYEKNGKRKADTSVNITDTDSRNIEKVISDFIYKNVGLAIQAIKAVRSAQRLPEEQASGRVYGGVVVSDPYWGPYPYAGYGWYGGFRSGRGSHGGCHRGGGGHRGGRRR